jgi:hypothetical protein
MEGHARTWFTARQKTELWERWKSGQCVADIARALERRIQPVDATPLHSRLAPWNGMHMEGHARAWFMPQLKAEP